MRTTSKLVLLTVSTALAAAGCGGGAAPGEPSAEEMVARGRYLVRLSGCNDCHTPKLFDAERMHEDESRLLSGRPADAALPEIDPGLIGPGKWYLFNEHLTAAVGPWGVSYAANLTPDEEAGTGAWSEAVFANAMRRGQHQFIELTRWVSLRGANRPQGGTRRGNRSRHLRSLRAGSSNSIKTAYGKRDDTSAIRVTREEQAA